MHRCAVFASMEDVRQHLLKRSLETHGSHPVHVAILRLHDGTPKLLTRPALDALCERLAVQQAAGGLAGTHELSQLPCALQVRLGSKLIACGG